MEFVYKTEGTCSKEIRFELNKGIVSNVRFLGGGCPGNLQALPRLVEGMSVEEIEQKISGINCGIKGTSCADQLARAVRKAADKISNENLEE